jgi:hypothetical protein
MEIGHLILKEFSEKFKEDEMGQHQINLPNLINGDMEWKLPFSVNLTQIEHPASFPCYEFKYYND